MSKANSTSNHKCIHQPQCISRYPKDPPSRIWNNGDGLTVLLPNWSSKSEIEKYETAFGEHSCKDCNTETIIFETGGMYRVRSCGNNLAKFEDCAWWTGEGDFSAREQQTATLMIDL